MSERPATYPELGKLIRALRPEGMTLREADKLGRKRGVREMSYSFLARLERGEIKHPPTAEQITGLATIYQADYSDLAQRVAGIVYELPTASGAKQPIAKPKNGRPVFNPDVGAAFRRFRLDAPNNTPRPRQKRLRPNSKPRTKLDNPFAAAREARKMGIDGLTQNMLFRAERGLIKRPSADFVRSLAKLYGYEYRVLANEIAKLSFGLTGVNTPTTEDRNNDGDGISIAVESASAPPKYAHVSPSPSISATSERTRALEAGLRDILAVATTLLGEAAGARFVDDAAVARGAERTSEEAPGASARDRRPYAKSAGARR